MATLTASEARSKLYRLIDETADFPSAHSHYRQTYQCCPCLRGGLEGHTGNGVSTLHSRYAGVDQRRSEYTH